MQYLKSNQNFPKTCGFRVADPSRGKQKALQPNVSAGQKAFFVEVLQAYSNRGRHYEDRFDKILVAKEKAHLPRKLRQRRQKSSAKLIHRLTPDQVMELSARYQQGWSSRCLADTYAISKTSVVQLLREAGVPIRNQGLTSKQAKEAAALYETGQSLAAIGHIYHVSADTIRKRLTLEGVTLRRPWERPVLLLRPDHEPTGSERAPTC